MVYSMPRDLDWVKDLLTSNSLMVISLVSFLFYLVRDDK